MFLHSEFQINTALLLIAFICCICSSNWKSSLRTLLVIEKAVSFTFHVHFLLHLNHSASNLNFSFAVCSGAISAFCNISHSRNNNCPGNLLLQVDIVTCFMLILQTSCSCEDYFDMARDLVKLVLSLWTLF